MSAPASVRGAGRVALEVAVTSPAGARAARDGGADRVELCAALELGGLTPSPAALEGCLEVDGALGVHVLVRPRPGDFVYDAEEARTTLRDVACAVRAGAAGVVVGALVPAGALDLELLAAAVAAARSVRPGAEVTLHRAVDQLPRPSEHVRQLARVGITRVLTSGGAASALDGLAELARAVAAGRAAGGVAGGVEVMAGGGVGPGSVAALVGAGVAAVHLSAKRPVAPRLPSRVAVGAGPAGAPGPAPAGEGTRWVTDPAAVAATRAALDAAVRAATTTATGTGEPHPPPTTTPPSTRPPVR